MDNANSDWDEFKRTLSSIQKANSIREQLNVLSAQLNEIEQDTKVLPELKEAIDGDEAQAENDQLMQAEQPDPTAMMGGMGMPPAPAPEGGMGAGEAMMKAELPEVPTEPTADAVNASDGDDMVLALFDQLINALSDAAHQALDAGDLGKLMKLSNVQGNLVALQKDIVPLSASVPVNELDGGAPIAKARSRGRGPGSVPSFVIPAADKGGYTLEPGTYYSRAGAEASKEQADRLANALEAIRTGALPATTLTDILGGNRSKEQSLREEVNENSLISPIPAIREAVFGAGDTSADMANLYNSGMSLMSLDPRYQAFGPEEKDIIRQRVIRDINSAILNKYGRILRDEGGGEGFNFASENMGWEDPGRGFSEKMANDLGQKENLNRLKAAYVPGKTHQLDLTPDMRKRYSLEDGQEPLAVMAQAGKDWESEIGDDRKNLYTYSTPLINAITRMHKNNMDAVKARVYGKNAKIKSDPTSRYAFVTSNPNSRVVKLPQDRTPLGLGDYLRSAGATKGLGDLLKYMGVDEKDYPKYDSTLRTTVGKYTAANDALKAAQKVAVKPKSLEESKALADQFGPYSKSAMKDLSSKVIALALMGTDLTPLTMGRSPLYNPQTQEFVWTKNKDGAKDLTNAYNSALKMIQDSQDAEGDTPEVLEDKAKRRALLDTVKSKLSAQYADLFKEGGLSGLYDIRDKYNTLSDASAKYEKDSTQQREDEAKMRQEQAKVDKLAALLPKGWSEILSADASTDQNKADRLKIQNELDTIDNNMYNLFLDKGYLKELNDGSHEFDLNKDKIGDRLLSLQNINPDDPSYERAWRDSLESSPAMRQINNWYRNLYDLAMVRAAEHKGLDFNGDEYYQWDENDDIIRDENGLPKIDPNYLDAFNKTYKDLANVFQGDKLRNTFLRMGMDAHLPAPELIRMLPVLDAQAGSMTTTGDDGTIDASTWDNLARIIKLASYRKAPGKSSTWKITNFGDSLGNAIDLETLIQPDKYIQDEVDENGKVTASHAIPLQDVDDYARDATIRQLRNKGLWNAKARVDKLEEMDDQKPAEGAEDDSVPGGIHISSPYLYKTKAEQAMDAFGKMYAYLTDRKRRKVDNFFGQQGSWTDEDEKALGQYMPYFIEYVEAQRDHNRGLFTKEELDDYLEKVANEMYEKFDNGQLGDFTNASPKGQFVQALNKGFKAMRGTDKTPGKSLDEVIDDMPIKDEDKLTVWAYLNGYADVMGSGLSQSGELNAQPMLRIDTNKSSDPSSWKFSAGTTGKNKRFVWGNDYEGLLSGISGGEMRGLREAYNNQLMNDVEDIQYSLPVTFGKIVDEYKRRRNGQSEARPVKDTPSDTPSDTSDAPKAADKTQDNPPDSTKQPDQKTPKVETMEMNAQAAAGSSSSRRRRSAANAIKDAMKTADKTEAKKDDA